MAKTIPMIITNKRILVKCKGSEEFTPFEMPGVNLNSNIPFYHLFAGKISECQYYFKQFMRKLYGKRFSKYILAIITPDDTTPLESIFINEFFVNSGACKAVAQMKMAQAVSKNDEKYVSISKSCRNTIVSYVNRNEIVACKCYDKNEIPDFVNEEANRIHIDVECSNLPTFINNLNMNMKGFEKFGCMIPPKAFLEKISGIDVEKM